MKIKIAYTLYTDGDYALRNPEYFGCTGTNVITDDGWVESEQNLSHDGESWIYDDAQVFGNASILGNARLFDNSCVHGNARVINDARVCGNVHITGDAYITNNDDYISVSAFGDKTITCFRCNDTKIRIIYGDFYGTIVEFKQHVKNTENAKLANEYIMLADLMEKRFS